MTYSYLILILPLFLTIQAAMKCVQWVRTGVAGIVGYEYRRSENPGWYFLTLASSFLLIAFYVFSAIWIFFGLKYSGGKVYPVLNWIYFLLLVSQSINIANNRKKAPTA